MLSKENCENLASHMMLGRQKLSDIMSKKLYFALCLKSYLPFCCKARKKDRRNRKEFIFKNAV